MPSCEFSFERSIPIYLSGERVTGRIDLVTQSQRELVEICSTFVGKCRARWVDSMARYPKTYTGEEMLINIRTQLRDGGSLMPGTYSFNFDIALPESAPTTCTTDFGEVRYDLTLEITELGNVMHYFKREITVLHPVSLKDMPNLFEPQLLETSTFFGCWPFAAGPVNITFLVPCRGYLAGDELKYTITIENTSKRLKVCCKIAVNFLQVYRYTASAPRTRTRYKTLILERMKYKEKLECGVEHAIDDFLVIPQIPPSTLGDHIVLMQYELRMEIDFMYSQQHLELAVPLVIGTKDNIRPSRIPRASAPRKTFRRL